MLDRVVTYDGGKEFPPATALVISMTPGYFHSKENKIE